MGCLFFCTDLGKSFADEDGFCQAVSKDEIQEKGNNLSIALYVRTDNTKGSDSADTISLEQAITNCQESSTALRESMERLFAALWETRMTGGDQ